MSTRALRRTVREQFGITLRGVLLWETLRRACVPDLLELVNVGRLNPQYVVELSRLPPAAQLEVVALGPAACRHVAKELRALRDPAGVPVCPYCSSPRTANHDSVLRREHQLDQVARSDQGAAVRVFNECIASMRARDPEIEPANHSPDL